MQKKRGIFGSALQRNWQLTEFDAQIIQEFMRTGLDVLSSQILINRGARLDEINDILEPKLKTQMPDPNCLKGMEGAVNAIIDAINSKKRIVIFADYDVDGATSAAILLSLFEKLNANVEIFVPDRIKDGYGPNPQLMRSIKESGCEILITVDCGAAAYEALQTASEINLPTIVFDHHLMEENAPPALALVNPNQFGDNSGLGHLTAAGVCFMAVVALNRELKARGIETNFNPIDILDLAALGTVCDVAPLRGLNRVIVAQGQKIISKLSRIGIAKLAQVSGLKKANNVFALSWVLGPRLNAGGRIGNSRYATEILTTNDETRANELALILEQLNQERRAIEQSVLEEAIAMVQNTNQESADLIIVGKQGWHPGIIGIVAGRLKERFSRPSIVLGSIDEDDKIAKGSGRSIEGVNLGGLIKEAVNREILLSGGGHKMAAGLSCEFSKIDEIREKLNQLLQTNEITAIENQNYMIDAIISLGAINIDLIDRLDRLSPFGAGWDEPRFLLQNVRVAKFDYLNGGHLRIFIKDENDNSINAICFSASGTKLGEILVSKQKIDLIVRFKRDDFRGGNSVSTEIIDASYAVEA